MIDTDKYEGCLADMKGYDLAILAEELLAEVKRLREQIQLLHDTWFADEEMASDVDERMTILLKEMIE
jgi:hypothetical protein